MEWDLSQPGLTEKEQKTIYDRGYCLAVTYETHKVRAAYGRQKLVNAALSKYQAYLQSIIAARVGQAVKEGTNTLTFDLGNVAMETAQAELAKLRKIVHDAPTQENIDAMQFRLNAANAEIASLEQQLDDVLEAQRTKRIKR